MLYNKEKKIANLCQIPKDKSQSADKRMSNTAFIKTTLMKTVYIEEIQYLPF